MAAIQKKAAQLEAERNETQLHSHAFGLGVIFPQIAILVSTIAALGRVPFANGFSLLF